MPLFKKTKILELKMDEFLNIVNESGLVFIDGVRHYLSDNKELFEEKINKLKKQENKADELRRAIEKQLYLETLIPESRGDVLALLETADNVINQVKATLLEFSVESPMVPKNFHTDFINT